MMRRSSVNKGYGSTYNIVVFNPFYLEKLLKDTESTNKNKLKNLLIELTGFKFATTLILKYKKLGNDDEI